LSDLTAEARREKKARRLKSLHKKIKSKRGDAFLRELDLTVQGDAAELSSARRGKDDPAEEARAKAKPPGLSKDMYRAFDGTALVAIGVLLEEAIRSQLDVGREQVDVQSSPEPEEMDVDG